jgi:hypothetical protein
MANRKRKAPDDTIGYGRPPKASQFKKGQSGNPRGRPKGSRPVGAILQDILGQRIAVTENGRTRRIPALEVMLRRLANDAMRNDSIALKTVLMLVDRYGESAESEIKLNDILSEDRAILERFLKQPQTILPNSTNRKSNKNDR